ncbi:uncharacterized protein LOC110177340 isoform X1 [Drosophila serrata]|uniref:uncharacterized protein LOC110177340 isoform X1 n=1 Tax=Drosophila serrata TaxID=7274 RepID=UPI000A1D17C3|nr:uncharacterized protein LOC110177340 isoform X1 [Drosophila serrata]
MRTINLILLIVSVGIVTASGQPFKAKDATLPDRVNSLSTTSASPQMETQSKREQGSEQHPINSTITTEAFKLFEEIFSAHDFKTNSSKDTTLTNSNSNETLFFKVPNGLTEDPIPLDTEDYEDKVEDEDPEGLGPRLSANLLKILTF